MVLDIQRKDSFRKIMGETSILGRMGYAITCFEKKLTFYNVQTPQIGKLTSFLWNYTLSTRLDLWEVEFYRIVPESVDDFIKQFDLQFLQYDICSFIFDILEDVYEVATGNLYGEYLSTYTEIPLTGIVVKLNA